jgi:hypothetical protein
MTQTWLNNYYHANQSAGSRRARWALIIIDSDSLAVFGELATFGGNRLRH